MPRWPKKLSPTQSTDEVTASTYDDIRTLITARLAQLDIERARLARLLTGLTEPLGLETAQEILSPTQSAKRRRRAHIS